MMIRGSSRRAFLNGVGLGAFALPFLRQVSARAAAPADAKRMVVFATPCGTNMPDFFPGAGNTYGRILKPLEPMKNKLLVMRGIDMNSAYKTPIPANHDPDFPNLLTAMQSTGNAPGNFGGISIDQHIANALGNKTKFASLQMGVNTFSLCGCISSSGPKGGIFPEHSPYKAFDRLFQDAVTKPDDLTRLRRERKSIIDSLRADVADLRCAIGADERPKLDAHLESIRELERGLAAASPGAGDTCTPPVLGAPVVETAATIQTNVPQMLKLHMDIVTAALACDLTRIVTLMVSHGSSFLSMKWLGINFTHHGIAHGSQDAVNTAPSERASWLFKIEEWHAKQFLYFIQKLDAIQDGGGSLLDHSAVLWAHEQSDGNSHSRKDMPFVLAGSCRNAFTLGRSVNFGGKSHNGLLMSLANGMGVPTQKFGDPDFSSGPLAGL